MTRSTGGGFLSGAFDMFHEVVPMGAKRDRGPELKGTLVLGTICAVDMNEGVDCPSAADGGLVKE